MRSCEGLALPSSDEDIFQAREAYDEVGDFESMLAYLSTLARTAAPENVRNALDRLADLPDPADTNQKSQIVFLKALCYYRLREDKLALQEAGKAIQQGFADAQTRKIHTQLTREAQAAAEAERETTYLEIAGGALLAVAGALAFAFFRRKR
jgi:hypothetical protein